KISFLLHILRLHLNKERTIRTLHRRRVKISSMSKPGKSLWVVVSAGIAFAVLAAFTVTRIVSHDRQMASLSDQMERMASRMDLLTEVVEAASARAIRAEENAAAAAEARVRAEKESDAARAEDQTSAEQARAALAEAEKIRQQREMDLNRLQQALGA